MGRQSHLKRTARFFRGAFYLLLLLAVCVIPFALGQRQKRAPFLMGNPTRIDWFQGPDLPSPGVRLVGVYFPANGKFYVMGGRSMDGADHDFVHPFEYDPVSNSWTIKAASYSDNQVSDMACGVLDDSGTDYIYCVGGSAGGQVTATARVFRYDPVNDNISIIPSLWPGNADGVTLPGGFSVVNDQLYILGGYRINTAMTDQIWRFAPGTNVWMQRTNLLVPRGYIPTATINNHIYMAGGSLWNGTMLQDTADSFSYDPVSDTISQIANMPRATAETQAIAINSEMFVFGGGETPPNPSNEVDVYDPPPNTWITVAPFMTARRNFATGTDGNCVWLVGGYASDGAPLSSMETSCPVAATPTATATVTPTATVPPSPTPTPTAPPCSVSSAGCGSIVTVPPTDFSLNVSEPVDPPTLDASDFAVNGIPADSVSLLNGNMTIDFTFNPSPAVPGVNTMHIAAGAFNCLFGGPVAEFTCTFRYEAPRVTPTPRPRPTPLRRP